MRSTESHNPSRGRFIAGWLLATFGLSCAAFALPPLIDFGDAPRLGGPAPRGSSVFGFVHKGGQLCSHRVVANGVRYDFDLRCDANVVVFVTTTDRRFRTPEGVAIGNELRAALAAKDAKLEIVDGECAVVLPSGWLARVAERDVPEDGTCYPLLREPIREFQTRFDMEARAR